MSQSTDGVWAGRLQNRWFLGQREICADEFASFSKWLCVLHLIETGYLHSACQAGSMASLAMGAQCFGWFVVRYFGFMHITVNHAI